MISRLKKNHFIYCLVFLLVYRLLFNVRGDFVSEKMLAGNGSLAPQQLTISDFTTHSMVRRDGSFIATDGDPQLHYVVDGDFYGMKFYMTSSMPTGEIPVYYTTAEGQDFSESRHTWAVPVKGEDGRYIIRTDLQRVHTLRIDPTTVAGNQLTFGDFTLNPEKTFAEYFPVNYRTVPLFFALTTVLWAISATFEEIFTFFRKKDYKK